MARHGKKPSEESTSPRAPRTLAGSATTNTSADSTDAAASGIAVNSSTVNRTFASESRQPQDLFDAAIAQGISDGDAWTDQHVKHIYRQIIITVVVVGRRSGRDLRIHRRARLAANARSGRAERLQGSRYGHERLLLQGVPAEGEDLRSVHQF